MLYLPTTTFSKPMHMLKPLYNFATVLIKISYMICIITVAIYWLYICGFLGTDNAIKCAMAGRVPVVRYPLLDILVTIPMNGIVYPVWDFTSNLMEYI
jgi:hypothetical protein